MCTPVFGAESFMSDRMSNQLMSIDEQTKKMGKLSNEILFSLKQEKLNNLQ